MRYQIARPFVVSLGIAAVLSAATLHSIGAAKGAFYGDPPNEHHPWAVHDMNRPKPPTVTPGTCSTQEAAGKPPSDAIVLFDGKNLDKFRSGAEGGGPAKWLVKDGYMEVVPGSGDLVSLEQFGDCQLHVEWAAPSEVKGDSQGRGNSGVFLMGLVEIQVLDNYNNPTYADGYASSVYGVNPPMANPLRPPGQFQVYDIVFRRPIWRDGKEIEPGYVTVFVNGVVTQDHTRLEGPTGHMKRTTPGPFPEKGPLKLQDHHNPMRFRNIWYRPLRPNAIEGGTDGYLTPEAAKAKRAQIGSDLRAEAQKLQSGSKEQFLVLAESLCYDKDPVVLERVEKWISGYDQKLQQSPKDQPAGKKDEIKQLHQAFSYLARFNIVPSAGKPAADLEAVIKAKKWDK